MNICRTLQVPSSPGSPITDDQLRDGKMHSFFSRMPISASRLTAFKCSHLSPLV